MKKRKLILLLECIFLIVPSPIFSQTSPQAVSTYNYVYSYDANGNITSRYQYVANTVAQSSTPQLNISITYNATSSKATVSVTGNDTSAPTSVNLYDISTNAEVDNITFSTDSHDIDLSARKRGLYIIEAINGSVLSAHKISKR